MWKISLGHLEVIRPIGGPLKESEIQMSILFSFFFERLLGGNVNPQSNVHPRGLLRFTPCLDAWQALAELPLRFTKPLPLKQKPCVYIEHFV